MTKHFSCPWAGRCSTAHGRYDYRQSCWGPAPEEVAKEELARDDCSGRLQRFTGEAKVGVMGS